jgi:hypothetical protein
MIRNAGGVDEDFAAPVSRPAANLDGFQAMH